MVCQVGFRLFFFVFLVILGNFNVHLSDSGCYGKRSLETINEDLIPNPKKPRSYPTRYGNFELNPPNIMDLLNLPPTCNPYPLEYQNFGKIFNSNWLASQRHYPIGMTEIVDLFKWPFESPNEVLDSLSFNTHISFIKTLLASNIFITEESFELIDEYIYYAMNREDALLSNPQLSSLLSSAVNRLRPSVLSLLLENDTKYLPLNSQTTIFIWTRFFRSASMKKVKLSFSDTQSSSLFEIFRILSMKLKPIEPDSFSMFQNEISRDNFFLHFLLIFQSSLASAFLQNSRDFLNHFNYIHTIYPSYDPNYAFFLSLFNNFLKFDKTIHYLAPSTREFADTLFLIISKKYPSTSEMIHDLIKLKYHCILQLILMNSSLARDSIPNLSDQCELLVPHLKVGTLSKNYFRIIPIIVGFKLSLEAIDGHLSSILGIYTNFPVYQGFKYILSVVESFSSNYDPSTMIWTLSESKLPVVNHDAMFPCLLDAGRIILAKHYHIPHTFTYTNSIMNEESCFRDLIWFINFYIKKYRADLGSDYEILIK